MEPTTTTSSTEKRTSGKRLRGVVVGVSMKDTVKVQVTRYIKHPRYGKFIKRKKNFLAHDPGNTAILGSTVVIQETRPISKNKHFKLVTE